MAVINETNISLSTVRDAVGGSNDLTSLFKQTLNETSKYKPTRIASDFTDMSFYSAADGNCGFTFPNSGNYTDIPSWYSASRVGSSACARYSSSTTAACR